MTDLATYLADYLEQEFDSAAEKKVILQEGLSAYQSTENITLVATGGDCPDCGKPMNNGSGRLWDGDGDGIEVGRYMCPDCGYLIYY